MSLLFELFWEYFKIGLFAVGGGPATIPYLMELTETKGWYTMQELTDMIAISESTPGPVGLNMATYTGFTSAGIWGGVVASIGLTLPSIIIITVIAKFLKNFSENRYVKAFFAGVRPAVTAIIAVSVYSLCKVSLFVETDGQQILAIKTLILAILVFILMRVPKLKKLHPVVWIIGGAVIGIVLRF